VSRRATSAARDGRQHGNFVTNSDGPIRFSGLAVDPDLTDRQDLFEGRSEATNGALQDGANRGALNINLVDAGGLTRGAEQEETWH
jgi:hypothetical protein